jgi:hypothetical protein
MGVQFCELCSREAARLRGMEASMGVSAWLVRKVLIFSQKKNNLTVDPDLLAGRAPRWAISMVRLVVILVALPFAVWVVFQVLPERQVIELGNVFREIIWTEVPVTALRHCGLACRDLVFGMVVLPVTWLAGIIGAVCWYGITKERLAYQEDRLRKQSAPTTARPAIDTLAEFLRNRRWLLVMSAFSLVLLHWALSRFVGDLLYYPDGRTKVFTTWRFGLLCALLGLGTAVVGSFVFIVQRMAVQRR